MERGSHDRDSRQPFNLTSKIAYQYLVLNARLQELWLQILRRWVCEVRRGWDVAYSEVDRVINLVAAWHFETSWYASSTVTKVSYISQSKSEVTEFLLHLLMDSISIEIPQSRPGIISAHHLKLHHLIHISKRHAMPCSTISSHEFHLVYTPFSTLTSSISSSPPARTFVFGLSSPSFGPPPGVTATTCPFSSTNSKLYLDSRWGIADNCGPYLAVLS